MDLKFSDAAIRALKAADAGQLDYADTLTPGLSIRVGRLTKTFMFRRMVAGKRQRITIGQYPDISLGKAREEARRYRAEKTLGLVEAKPASLFPEVVEEFLTIKRQSNRPNTIRQTSRHLHRHFRFEGDVAAIDARMLAKAIEAIKAPIERRNAYAAIRALFNWLAKQRRIPFSPVTAIDAPRKGDGRDRVLTDDELVRIWRSAPGGVYGDVVRLLILSGQRSHQLCFLKADFIQEDTIVWPGTIMKSGKRHTLPLTPAMDSILNEYRKEGYIFADNKPYRIRDTFKGRLDRASGVTRWVHHDIRRTVATKMAELGVLPHLVDRILAHAQPVIAAIYNRHGYEAEMREALLLWDQRLQALLSTTERPHV